MGDEMVLNIYDYSIFNMDFTWSYFRIERCDLGRIYSNHMSSIATWSLTVFRKGKLFVWDNFYRPTTFSIEYNAIPV